MKALILILSSLVCGSLFAQTGAISRGNRLYKDGQFDQAEAEYRKALEEDPDNAAAMHNLANALFRQGKFDESAKLNTSLAKIAKDTGAKAGAYYNQGVSFTKQNKLEESIEAYKNALRQNPNDQLARENLQKALQQQKNQQSQNQQKQKSSSDMSQKEADQKLKQLQQREKELQQKLNEKKESGSGQAQDW